MLKACMLQILVFVYSRGPRDSLRSRGVPDPLSGKGLDKGLLILLHYYYMGSRPVLRVVPAPAPAPPPRPAATRSTGRGCVWLLLSAKVFERDH